jgi:hypothetical protein
MSHFHILMANRQWMQDRNATTAPQTEYQVDNLNYTGSLFSTKARSHSAVLICSRFLRPTPTQPPQRFSVSANKVVLQQQTQLWNFWLLYDARIEQRPFATILNLSSQHNYALTQHHGIALQFNLLSNQAKVAGADSFTEYNIDLGYTYTF